MLVTDGWECTSTAPGLAPTPAELPAAAAWLAARVPGTFAAALRDAGMWNGQAPLELDHQDIWYRTRFKGGGEETLHFAGLATIAEVWLNGACILRSENMFLPRDIAARTGTDNELHICFRSLAHWLQGQRGRARWRTRIATPSSLRFARTTLLGRMPGWCPVVHPVGPWRPVSRAQRGAASFSVQRIDAASSVADGNGRVALRCILNGAAPADVTVRANINGYAAQLQRTSHNEFAGEVLVRNVALWWPHTHGASRLYRASLSLDHDSYDLGHVGFRTIEIDRGNDGKGFGLRVNGQPIFCRGACWTTADLVTLSCEASQYRPWLEALRDAGANMVRVGGTMLYESDAFYALCDELGLLVWQDAMLANFDYPTTSGFRESLKAELEDFLHRTQLNPCLTIFCGGSEVLQQAAMFGLAGDRIDDELYRSVIPELVQRLRPDLPYVINSPSGGELPFVANVGVTHYYGVGAYCRPLDDARRAELRFASECLALANVPCARTVDELRVSSTTEPRWKQAVPRDPGVAWDFEDIRDHYLATLMKVAPLHLRYAEFTRYLELSRAVSCILLEETFNEWRRVGSTCQGALIWQWQDVTPGAGWGLMDALGRRKPVWYALQRACRTRQLILTDEGLNGLAVHILNETHQPLDSILWLDCLSEGGTPVRQAEHAVRLPPRAVARLNTSALISGFFDITYAYKFGPPTHEVTVASLHDRVTGVLLADACHFPDMAALKLRDVGLEVSVDHDAQGWSLRLLTRRFAQFVHIDDRAFTAAENWLHLAPGRERRIHLLPPPDQGAIPCGEVRALNMDRVMQYTGQQ